MQDSHSIENSFLNKISEIIEENISNERFGVSELAHEAGMSRSNLLRKVKKITKLSASQFIRQVRLKKGLEMLRQTSFTVSEVSYQVGFSSTSYFIKCFRDYYGYPPGEVGRRDEEETDTFLAGQTKRRRMLLFGGGILIVLIALLLLILFKSSLFEQKDLEKSIAVLPFKNDSNDSANLYIINGLMESVLNNLQKIEDLRVISRTSVEKYRYAPQIIPEIARELNVNYFVEGSGQKIGDQILLNIQLIEAESDRHLWSKQYNRDAKDIFELQKEVARNIADEIEAIITPEETERIEKAPTDDLVAYDFFLQGLDLFFSGDPEELLESITFFEKAIEHDNEFARAYADIAIAYFFLDMQQEEKKYSALINNYADKALLFDSKLPQSLIAKALYHINNRDYEQAVPYLEKALEYNPNSALVINILSDFYTSYSPNTEKYLEYALKGISLDIAANDSVTTSFIYLHVGNAFIQTGFIDEAECFLDKSLEYDPQNLYSEYVKAFILYARDRNLKQTNERLIQTYKKDTTRYDVIQEIGKILYYMRDYENAYWYYRKFMEIKEASNLDVYPGENAKIGVVLSEMGLKDESEEVFNEFLEYTRNDKSIYRDLSLAAYYSFHGEAEKALEHFELFSQQENYHYWVILFLKIDPVMDNIKDLPEFKSLFNKIETKFWNSHKRIRASLEEKELL